MPLPGGRVWEGCALPRANSFMLGRLGEGETGFPHYPSLRGGFGRAAPSREQIVSCWGGWGKGKPGFPMPLPGGRVWEGYALPRTNGFMLGRLGEGETGFPHYPSLRGGFGRAAPSREQIVSCWGGWGKGKPGFPTPLPGGRVWEGYALPRTNSFMLGRLGEGETGFPHYPSLRGGFGRATPSREQMVSCWGGWGKGKPGFPITPP